MFLWYILGLLTFYTLVLELVPHMKIDTKGMFTLKALGHGSLLTMVSHFLNEIIQKSMDYNPKSFASPLM
jgi:hypothetical protein